MSVAALQGHLRRLRALIEHLPPEIYRSAPSGTSGSIGAHVRHSLDHARSLLALRDAGEFSYDARVRGTRVETDPHCAADEIVRLCVALEDLEDAPFERAVTLRVATDDALAPAVVVTSLGREVAFVVQHTIHHCALIAMLLERAHVAVPARFGYAPSTPVRH